MPFVDLFFLFVFLFFVLYNRSLLRSYKATDGSNWVRNTNWLADTDPCDPLFPWFGVTCALVTERTLPDLYNTTSVRGVTVRSFIERRQL